MPTFYHIKQRKMPIASLLLLKTDGTGGESNREISPFDFSQTSLSYAVTDMSFVVWRSLDGTKDLLIKVQHGLDFYYVSIFQPLNILRL